MGPSILQTFDEGIGNTACPERPSLYVAQPPLDHKSRPRIQKVLIANRGEIACRIIATCRKISLTSVAVYVDEDASSRHVSDADEAINIGSINGAKTNPFLNIKLLVDKSFIDQGVSLVFGTLQYKYIDFWSPSCEFSIPIV